MSKGLGKWQRAILARLNTTGYFYLVDLLPDSYRMKEYQALYRAAVSLYNKRQVDITKYMCGSKKVLIVPVGATKLNKRPNCATEKRIIKDKSLSGVIDATAYTLKS
jgi:hypothetical protein